MDKYLNTNVKPIVFFFIAGFILFAIPQINIRVNLSNSLPYWLFMCTPAHQNNLKYGDIVSFRHQISTLPLAKQMVGFPGDPVHVDVNHVYVNNYKYGEIKKESPSGLKLNPIQDCVIPEGYFFAHGEHDISFDSRYAEFGLIRLDDVLEVLCPIF